MIEFYEEATLVLDEAAKTYTIDATSRNHEHGVRSKQNLRTILDNMFRKDEVLSSAVTTKVDSVPRYKIVGTNKANIEHTENNLWDEEKERYMWYNLFLYGNCFFEVERNAKGRPVALHGIEPMTVEILDPEGHGEPVSYVQRWVKSEIRLPAQDVLHFTLDRVTTGLWGEIPVQPIASYIAIKHWVKSHVNSLFKNNYFRPRISLPAEAKDEHVKSMLSYFKGATADRDKPYITFGDTDVEPYMNFEDARNFKEWIQLADNGILMHMQVPPIMAGMPDNSGRSSGEQQTYKAFNTHIQGVVRNHQGNFRKQMARIGLTGVEKRYAPVDKKTEKDVLEMADRLKNLGAKSDKLQEWLETQGFELPENFFDENSEGSTSEDMMPSRQRLAEGEMNERVGTGQEGETREDQLIDEAASKSKLPGSAVDRIKELARMVEQA